MAVGTKLYSYLKKSIRGADLFEYWVEKKKRITSTEIQNIDWEANGKAMRIYGYARQQWVSNLCQVGVLLGK